jgi:hypothetical protein
VTLIAEDLLLLLVDDATGKLLLDTTRLDRVLAGAVLVELALAERVGPPEPGQRFGRDRIAIVDRRPTGDPILDGALGLLDTPKPPGATRAVEKLVKGLRRSLLTRLVEAGFVREEHRSVLGIFPSTRFPAVRPDHENQLRTQLRAVLVDGQEPDRRAAALISLLAAVHAAPKIAPDADRRAVARRAEAVARGDWAGVAVRRAVDAVNAAVTAAIVAATTAATTS